LILAAVLHLNTGIQVIPLAGVPCIGGWVHSADEITDELHRNFAEIAPRALNILADLAENADSESVRLGATRDLLDRAGFRPVDRHEIVKEKSVEELNAQLVSLVGENGAEMLISAFRSRKSFSGPELVG